jgi:hypothetical protein
MRRSLLDENMLIFPHQSGRDDKEERSGHKLFLTGRMALGSNF